MGSRGSRRWGAAAVGLLVGGTWAARWFRSRRTSLAGQVALVTGGSRGLGYLIASELAREGCRLVICGRDAEELERAREALVAQGAQVRAVVCDVSETSDVERLVDDTMMHFGCIDVLVNNAGVLQAGALEHLTLDDFQQTMATNFWGTVYTTLAVLPYMKARGNGRIINVTSIGGKLAMPRLLPYDTAKFAALGFSEGLRTELARDGVSVTSVIPGLLRPGSAKRAAFKGSRRGDRLWFGLASRLPGLSMNAAHVARRIVSAAKRRDPELVIGLPAKILHVLKDLSPRFALRMLSVTNRLLPGASRR